MVTKTGLLRIPTTLIKDVESLKKQLSITNPEYESAKRFSRFGTNVPKILYFFDIDPSDRTILVPRNIELPEFDFSTVVDNTSMGREIKGIETLQDSPLRLRDYQEEFINDEVIPNLGISDLTFIMKCGTGKTIVGLYTALLRKRNTLIVCSTNNQIDQYLKNKPLFPAHTISRLLSSEKNTVSDIILTTYDMLSDAKFDEAFFSQFGHIICDETHRVGAPTYNGIFKKAICHYRTAMTATYRRKDGMEKILKVHTGKILELKKEMEKVIVFPVRTGSTIDLKKHRTVESRSTNFKYCSVYTEYLVKDKVQGTQYDVFITEKKPGELVGKIGNETVFLHEKFHKIYRYTGISMASIDTGITEDEQRNKSMIYVIQQLTKAGRVVIAISRRKEILYKYSKELDALGITNGVVASDKAQDYKEFCKSRGRTTLEETQYAYNEASVILGIDKIAQEGMDVDRADTVILLHPIRDVEQVTGRVQREFTGKKKPIFIYPLDDIAPYDSYYSGKDGARKMFISLEHTLYKTISINEFLKLIA